MKPETALPARESRGGGAGDYSKRSITARPIPMRVGLRKPGNGTLPASLALRPVQFRWKLVWQENVRALLPVTQPDAAAGHAPESTQQAPLFTLLDHAQKPEPAGETQSNLTTLGLGSEMERAPDSVPERIDDVYFEYKTGGRAWLKWAWIALAAAGVLGGYKFLAPGGAGSAAKQPSPRASRAPSAMLPVGKPIQMAPAGWRSTPAEDAAGISAGRRFSLYRSLAPMTDYIVEFQGTVITKSLGWVVRASDPKNYYAMRLELVKAGPVQEVELVRWAVVDGEQGAEKRVPVPALIQDKTMKVRVDVVGPRITTYVNGRAVDLWNDVRLGSGTFGFMNDKESRAEIKFVRVSSPGGPPGS